jgi:hypothetical protein
VKFPRRDVAFFFFSSIWGFGMLVGLMMVAVGRDQASIVLGCIIGFPGVVLLARPAHVRDGVLITRRPVLMTPRRVVLADVAAVRLCTAPDEWGGRWGSSGVQLVLADHRVVPIIESTSFRASHAQRWAVALVQLVRAADRPEQRDIEVQLHPTPTSPKEHTRQRVAFARDHMSLTDPAESLRTVRRALVGTSLISVRPTFDGFRVYVEADDGSKVSESEDYPTMELAIEAAIAEVSRRA